MLAKNEYPKTFGDKYIRGFRNFKRPSTKAIYKITTQLNQQCLTCRLTFPESISLQLQIKIRPFLCKKYHWKNQT